MYRYTPIRRMNGRKLRTTESSELPTGPTAVTFTWWAWRRGISWSSVTAVGICDSKLVPSSSLPVTAPFASIETEATLSAATSVLNAE